MASIEFNYTIPFGTSLRVGYRATGSSGPFTYIATYPAYDESPYTLSGIPSGLTDIELTTLCPSCSGGLASSSYVFTATAS